MIARLSVRQLSLAMLDNGRYREATGATDLDYNKPQYLHWALEVLRNLLPILTSFVRVKYSFALISA